MKDNVFLGRFICYLIFLVVYIFITITAYIANEPDVVVLTLCILLAGSVVFSRILKQQKWASEMYFMLNTAFIWLAILICNDKYWSVSIVILIIMLQWMEAQLFLNINICRFLFGLDVIFITGLKIYNGRVKLNSLEFVTMLLVLWLCYSISRFLVILVRERDRHIKEQELSNADMLKLVNEKCQEAKKAAKNRSSFLSNMSHEIRTPINTIIGMNQMILRECKDRQIKDYAEKVDNSSNMLLELINDILDYSKIDSGKFELVNTEYKVADLITDLTGLIQARAHAKDLKLQVDIDPSIPSLVYGDDVRIKQIVLNLLTNAVKYTHEGEITLSVTGKREDNFYQFRYSVKDTGIGIKEEDLSKLFSEFVRIDEKKNRNIEGTGLGLSITHQLLGLMGSKLQVESQYGKGSTFYFDLEQKIVDFEPIGNYQMGKDEREESEYEASFIAPDARVLVVDDNQMNREVFASLLKETLISVDQADSGEKCLELIHENRYDVIFMDHMMPEMDGIETLQAMQSSEYHYNRQTPVIVLTANAISGARDFYMKQGFVDYLTKPIIPDDLENMLRNYLPKEKLKKSQEKTQKVVDTPKVDISTLPTVEGLDYNIALLHFNDINMMTSMLTSFYGTIDTEANKLQHEYEDLLTGDTTALDRFRIQVHAMKSASNLVGIFVLGGIAATLEYAARDGKMDVIKDLTPHFLHSYRSYKSKLSDLLGKGNTLEKIENSKEIKEALRQLIDAAGAMDISMIDTIMEFIDKYEFPDMDLIAQLKAAATDLDDALIEQLVGKINLSLEN